ncbi:Catabolite control protein A [Pseudoruegeria aquimaris]|uniref:Catabolite control protein A n=1 Tax=Pseudoruegeria aquimaris TaxID=393663 RepID=A0A1Y5T1M1_9RHOB|nr:LacI family DNA-binding transcriptional regulator [Pseudoruegeria aquimaris]SLN53526.1 Catabolite control protein A [Pseudoruegeria aquimaris]
MKQRPTILDVAKQAGVSKSTVSLVLQGNPAVKEETRKAVRQAMADIGYVYNRSAATLRSATSGLIGLVINDLRNPFFTEFAASFQMELSNAGFATVLANADEDPGLQRRMIASLAEHGVAGFIISPCYGEEAATLSELAASGTPTLQVFRRLEAEGGALPFLAPDYLHGGRLAAEHLIQQGCRNIAFLGGLNDRPVTRERMSGYLSVLEEHGRAPLVLRGQSTRAFGKDAAARLRREHPEVDGVICFNDLVALGVLAACPDLGMRAGQDLRVVGFDDIEDSRDSYPPLTTISCNIPDFAATAARRIVAWIKEGEAPPASARSPVRLVVRASSGVNNRQKGTRDD